MYLQKVEGSPQSPAFVSRTRTNSAPDQSLEDKSEIVTRTKTNTRSDPGTNAVSSTPDKSTESFYINIFGSKPPPVRDDTGKPWRSPELEYVVLPNAELWGDGMYYNCCCCHILLEY